ncbi:MAG TPA: DNA translocase FtsK 4TM domain-containing protein, partial [Steroidobacteraceae bacterium]
MADTTARGGNSLKFTAAVARGLRESAVIALAVIALVLFAALASYHSTDPGFSYTGESAVVQNRIGPIGAWIADVLFFLFGWPAFLFPAMLGVSCWTLFRNRDKSEVGSRANTAVRIGGFVLVLIASCGLATLHWETVTLRQSAGGVIGSMVGHGLAAGLNFLGATLLLIAAWMAGLSLAFGVSWLTIMDRIGAWTWGAIDWVRSQWSTSRDVAAGRERKQARQETIKTEQKKSSSRPPPRIEAPPPPPPKSERVERERQVPLFDPPKAGELPPLNLLDEPPPHEPAYSAEALEALSRLVEMKLKDFGIEVEVVAVQPGPVVTRFELRPAPGVKASQITSLSKDLARSLSVLSVR